MIKLYLFILVTYFFFIDVAYACSNLGEKWVLVGEVNKEANFQVYVNREKTKEGQCWRLPRSESKLNLSELRKAYLSKFVKVIEDRKINYKGQEAYYLAGIRKVEDFNLRIDIIYFYSAKYFSYALVSSKNFSEGYLTNSETKAFMDGLNVK